MVRLSIFSSKFNLSSIPWKRSGLFHCPFFGVGEYFKSTTLNLFSVDTDNTFRDWESQPFNQIWVYFTFGKAYFGNAYLYFQIQRILVRRIWRTLKKVYLGVITTKYNFNKYFHIRNCILSVKSFIRVLSGLYKTRCILSYF